MTALALIGLLPRPLNPVAAPKHVSLTKPDWTALAVPVDPLAMEDEAGVIDLADRQNRILSAYIRDGDVIPVSLGAVFSDAAALALHVDAAWPSLTGTVNRLSGAFEYSLHVEVSAQPHTTAEGAEDGAAFLLAKRRSHNARRNQHNARRAQIDSLVKIVDAQAAELRHFRPRGDHRLASMALLVARDRSEGLIEQIADWSRTAADMGLSCRMIGPSPAYSYTIDRGADV